MANNKFFTNTYITGRGRHNYLRIDYLEDPLFTSFTFDIDYVTSPLFYNIRDYSCAIDRRELAEEIEIALNDMYYKNMASPNEDNGYDILPLYSSGFENGKKIGYGLQQNVYLDLPLYGATEYIYMVDKRNGGESQNDARYTNRQYTESGSNSVPYNSYKLGDSIKEIVNESDLSWAEKQMQHANEQHLQSTAVMEETLEEHQKNESEMKAALEECNNSTQTVEGDENSPLTEAQLIQKVNEYKQLDSDFEQLKLDIADWVNGELMSFQSKMTALYTQNKCIQKIISYDDVSKDIYKEELKKLYGENFVTEYIWDGSNSYLKKSLELYNSLETYSRSRSGHNETSYFVDDDGRSILVVKDSGNIATVRTSLVEGRYGDRLQRLGLKNEDGTFNKSIQVKPSIETQEWVYNLSDRLEYFVNGMKSLTEAIVVNPMRYACDVGIDFGELESETYTKNQEMLAKYEAALDEIRFKLYGMSNGEVCDITNPTPDSAYGRYLAAKEKYENDDYSQAEKVKELAESSMGEMVDMITDYNESVLPDNEAADSDADSDFVNTDTRTLLETPEDGNIIVNRDPQQSKETGTVPLLAPQTVLDMLGFISGMKKLTTEYPYVLKGVTGLDTAYNKHYGITDPYLGSGDDKITLTCWESLDLRVSSMFNRYFNAVYDRQYRRERVPVNLRRFNCSVYVHDVRNFVSKMEDRTNRIMELKDMYYSVIEFRFYDCEIVPEETGNIFNDISNEAPSEMKTTNFTFKYGNCVVNFAPH